MESSESWNGSRCEALRVNEEDHGVSGSQIAGFVLGAVLGCIPGGGLSALLTWVGVESAGIQFTTFLLGPVVLGYVGGRWGPGTVAEMWGSGWP